jgi:hypothetical protein
MQDRAASAQTRNKGDGPNLPWVDRVDVTMHPTLPVYP